MRLPMIVGAAVVLLAGGYAASRIAAAHGPPPAASPAAPAAAPRPAPPALAVTELLDGGATLRPSPRALALAGQRVRLTGYMAKMEQPPARGFMLSPRPVSCDEAGGGTADLPPESVLVLPPPGQPDHPPFVPGALQIEGVLVVGNHADEDGHVSAFRLEPVATSEEKP